MHRADEFTGFAIGVVESGGLGKRARVDRHDKPQRGATFVIGLDPVEAGLHDGDDRRRPGAQRRVNIRDGRFLNRKRLGSGDAHWLAFF